MGNLQSGNHHTAAEELEKIIEDDNYMLPAYYNLTVIKLILSKTTLDYQSSRQNNQFSRI